MSNAVIAKKTSIVLLKFIFREIKACERRRKEFTFVND